MSRRFEAPGVAESRREHQSLRARGRRRPASALVGIHRALHPKAISDDPARALARNLEVLEALTGITAAHLRRGSLRAALFYASVAAGWASSNHAGVFASGELEALCRQAADALTGRPSGSDRRIDDPVESVLHVMSETHDVGGHTRLIQRWIERDSNRRQSVVVTRARASDVPRDLAAAVAGAGGRVYGLGGARDPLDRVRRLQALAAQFDRVVATVHADDVVPAVAFADARLRPPCIWLDHQDFKFWIGVGSADVVVNHRERGRVIARDRRGVPIGRSLLLPLPLDPPRRELRKSEERRRLGVPGDACVLLTVARPSKFMGSERPPFADAVSHVLDERRDAALVAVGPRSTDGESWTRLVARHPGRVVLAGLESDPAPYYAVADVYLDPFAGISETAALEAGGYGVPIVSKLPAAEGGELLAFDDPALGDELVVCADAASWREAVLRLVDDEQWRSDLGKATAERIARTHGHGWAQRLEQLYSEAGAAGSGDHTGPPAASFEGLDLHLVREMQAWGWSRPLVETLHPHAVTLDPGRALRRHIYRSLAEYELHTVLGLPTRHKRPLWRQKLEDDLLAAQVRRVG